MNAATPFDQLRVADLMTLDPVVIDAGATIEQAGSLIASKRISGLPVVDVHGRLVGVISRTDLLGDGSAPVSALLRGNASGLRVAELMTAPPITVAMTATLAHAALVMHTHGIHRLVAIDDSGHPIGVLSASDYVAALADRC